MHHAHIRLIAARMVPQQQQHAERRTVEVGGVFQVDDYRIGPIGLAFVGVTKLLMFAEIEAPLDLDRQLIPFPRKISLDCHASDSFDDGGCNSIKV